MRETRNNTVEGKENERRTDTVTHKAREREEEVER